jgi:colanic acid biosynthesis glycosyl transferase WcaI
MRIQLWSHSFAPEPTGIGPVNTVWARGLRERGHEVEVVAAHPHYPEPRWGTRRLPYREVRDDIPVLRLPMWVGRGTAFERYRQELTFMAALGAAAPFLGRPDVLVSTSPMLGALLPAVANVRARRVPWVLWLHDLLPDGAAATGLVDEGGLVISLARRLERAAYRTAARVVVLSRSFTENLVAKNVPAGKIDLIYDPATRVPQRLARPGTREAGLRLISMGNIGHSQGLAPLIRAFEAHPELTGDASMLVAGTGVAAEEARAELRSGRVEIPGLLDDERLERELGEADVALVTQRYEGLEFNIPCKLMNFMAYGLPILAVVDPAGEVARIVREANAGWVVDSKHPKAYPAEVARISRAKEEIRQRAANARRYAEQHFTQAGFVAEFERTLRAVVTR